MTTTDNIFALEPGNTPAFERTALETFRFQADRCAVYREYLDRIGVVPAEVTRIEQIPFLPIELFKRREVYAGDRPPEIVFTSSNTGGTTPSRHFMQSLAHYERRFSRPSGRFTAIRPDGASTDCCPTISSAKVRRWSIWPTD